MVVPYQDFGEEEWAYDKSHSNTCPVYGEGMGLVTNVRVVYERGRPWLERGRGEIGNRGMTSVSKGVEC